MHARQENKIILTMSPKELRDLADKMEKRWATIKLGETTFVDFLHYADGSLDSAIVLHLDQEYFQSLERVERMKVELARTGRPSSAPTAWHVKGRVPTRPTTGASVRSAADRVGSR